jgi:phosphoribosylformylglycinamidine cyclo-ligase
VGGETAEHPGLLGEDEFDIAGAATGVVDAHLQLGAHRVKSGDVLIAMPASGIHANGFSLVRHILATHKIDITAHNAEFGRTLGEVLLTPTEIYALDCLALIRSLKENLRTYSHITGGGLADNTARVIPDGLTATYDRSTWSLPHEMQYLAQIASVPQADMERTWNAGIGMVAIVDPGVAELTLASLAARGMSAWVAGEVKTTSGTRGSAALAGTYKSR